VVPPRAPVCPNWRYGKQRPRTFVVRQFSFGSRLGSVRLAACLRCDCVNAAGLIRPPSSTSVLTPTAPRKLEFTRARAPLLSHLVDQLEFPRTQSRPRADGLQGTALFRLARGGFAPAYAHKKVGNHPRVASANLGRRMTPGMVRRACHSRTKKPFAIFAARRTSMDQDHQRPLTPRRGPKSKPRISVRDDPKPCCAAVR